MRTFRGGGATDDYEKLYNEQQEQGKNTPMKRFRTVHKKPYTTPNGQHQKANPVYVEITKTPKKSFRKGMLGLSNKLEHGVNFTRKIGKGIYRYLNRTPRRKRDPRTYSNNSPRGWRF